MNIAEQLRNAVDARSAADAELRSYYAEHTGKEETAELRAGEDAIYNRIEAQDKRIDALTTALQNEQRANSAANSSLGSGRSENRNESGNIMSGINQRTGINNEEFESFKTGESRNLALNLTTETRDNVTLQKGVATDGAEVVTSTMHNQILSYLRNSDQIFGDLGPKTLITRSGEDLLIPVLSSFSNSAIVAELGTIGADAPQFTQVTLGSYKYAQLINVSAELSEDAGAENFNELVSRQGVEALGHSLGAHVVAGSGSSQPNGIFTGGTVGVTANSATAVTADELVDLVESVEPRYQDGAVFLMNQATWTLVRKLKDGDGRHLMETSLRAGVPHTLLGYPVLITPSAPAATTGLKSIAFGNLQRGVMLRIVRGFEVRRSDEFLWNQDAVSYRFKVRADSDIVDPNAFKLLEMA